jgi:hypothetical protein
MAKEDVQARSDEIVDARRALRHLASRLMAYHQTELFALGILRWFGIDVHVAARDMFLVANTVDVFGMERHQPRKAIQRSLRLRGSDTSHIEPP